MDEQCIISTTHGTYHYLDTFDGQTGKHLSTTLSPMHNYRQTHLEAHPKKLLISSHYNASVNNTNDDKNYIKLVTHQMVDYMDAEVIIPNHCHPICAAVST